MTGVRDHVLSADKEEMKNIVDGIRYIEKALGKKAVKNMLPMQAGDVVATFAEISDLRDMVGFAPSTPLNEGIGKFVAWYVDYYGSKQAASL